MDREINKFDKKHMRSTMERLTKFEEVGKINSNTHNILKFFQHFELFHFENKFST